MPRKTAKNISSLPGGSGVEAEEGGDSLYGAGVEGGQGGEVGDGGDGAGGAAKGDYLAGLGIV